MNMPPKLSLPTRGRIVLEFISGITFFVGGLFFLSFLIPLPASFPLQVNEDYVLDIDTVDSVGNFLEVEGIVFIIGLCMAAICFMGIFLFLDSVRLLRGGKGRHYLLR